MIISGRNAVYEMLRAGRKIEKVLSTKELESDVQSLIHENKVSYERIDQEQLYRLTKSKTNQGIVAFVPEFQYSELEDILRKENAFIVIVDGVQDPHNLGSIIRTCECAGVDGIILPKNRACPINATVYTTSAGAIANMKIAQVTNLNETIRQLQKANVWVYALEADGENIFEANLTGSVALVVGSEGFGVHHLTKQVCDGILSLPLNGKINSLNASNACAIAVYEVVRQRGKK